ncbi:MAG: DMT family transporter [Hansschlegelia sp.]
MIRLLTPVAFVALWSTGWVVAGIVIPHASPLAFLILRYVCAVALLAPLAFALKARWPRGARLWIHALLNGALLHGVYLGGVWWAIEHGVPSGVSALIAALQPLFTALVAGPLIGERLGLKKGLGVALGMAGVAAVVAPKLAGVDAIPAWPVAINVLAMLAVTAATLHQKRSLTGLDLRGLAVVQYLGAIAISVPVAAFAEPIRFAMTVETGFALAWSVIALSIVAIFMMLAMIERGEVSRMSALIFLVPPLAAIQAYLAFGERFSAIQVVGMALAAVGVLLVNAQAPAPSAEGCIAANGLDDEDGGETLRRQA